jgi:hypothetical protein
MTPVFPAPPTSASISHSTGVVPSLPPRLSVHDLVDSIRVTKPLPPAPAARLFTSPILAHIETGTVTATSMRLGERKSVELAHPPGLHRAPSNVSPSSTLSHGGRGRGDSKMKRSASSDGIPVEGMSFCNPPPNVGLTCVGAACACAWHSDPTQPCTQPTLWNKRQLLVYAKPIHLWALGIVIVLGGQFLAWNRALKAGIGTTAICALLIAAAYLNLILCLAEMSSAM